MNRKFPNAGLNAVFGPGLAAALAASPMAQADANPFAAVEFQDAYLVAAADGEASCGAGMAEGKCGSAPEAATAKDAQGHTGAAAKDAVAKSGDAKPGEGKLGN